MGMFGRLVYAAAGGMVCFTPSCFGPPARFLPARSLSHRPLLLSSPLVLPLLLLPRLPPFLGMWTSPTLHSPAPFMLLLCSYPTSPQLQLLPCPCPCPAPFKLLSGTFLALPPVPAQLLPGSALLYSALHLPCSCPAPSLLMLLPPSCFAPGLLLPCSCHAPAMLLLSSSSAPYDFFRHSESRLFMVRFFHGYFFKIEDMEMALVALTNHNLLLRRRDEICVLVS